MNPYAPRRARFPMFAALLLCAATQTACGVIPTGRTVVPGQLAPCDTGPHCVSSREAKPERRIAPLVYRDSQTAAEARLIGILEAMPRTAIVARAPGSLHATTTSALLRFVDDVQFEFAADGKTIDMRSSSRIGYYDFGVNRTRLEAVRVDFEKP